MGLARLFIFHAPAFLTHDFTSSPHFDDELLAQRLVIQLVLVAFAASFPRTFHSKSLELS